MAPRWPLLYLAGPPVRAGRGPRAEEVSAASAADAAARIGEPGRGADFAFWAGAPGGHGLVVRDGGDGGDGGDVVAAGAGGPGTLPHLTVAAGTDPAAAVLAAVGAFAEPLTVCLAGPHPAVPPLLAAGWRIFAYDHHMSSSPGLVAATGVLSPSLR
jgi:hypothetical protein